MNTTTPTPSLPVSIDRTTRNARGRAATIFVYHTEDTTAAEKRAAAAAHLLPGEVLQGDCQRRTGQADYPLMFEFAVFN